MSSKTKPTLEGFTIPRAVKGEARSAVPPAPDETGEGRGHGADPIQSRSQGPIETVELSLSAVMDQMVPPDVETRTTVSVRLTLALQERLRVFAFQTRRNKQVILEEALDAYLRAHGR